MAVQAQYHHHHAFLARGGEQDGKAAPAPVPAMELPQLQKPTRVPPPLFLDFSRGDGGNARKRSREAEAASQRVGLLSLQPEAQKVVSLAQLQKRPAMAAASTGLQLDFDEPSEHGSSTSSSSFLSDELAAQLGQHQNEMDQLLQEHGERLRRTLAQVMARQYRALISAAEAAAARRMREKEAEAVRAARRGAELEEWLARLRSESAAWQAKALAEQSAAAALHAQLQQAAAMAQARGTPDDDKATTSADDAESGFVDPDRVEVVAPPPARPCRSCRLRPASVVLLPCRHLSVCDACAAAVPSSASSAGAPTTCPMCRCAVTGTVQVLFS